VDGVEGMHCYPNIMWRCRDLEDIQALLAFPSTKISTTFLTSKGGRIRFSHMSGRTKNATPIRIYLKALLVFDLTLAGCKNGILTCLLT
jgi:hypothetical protein